MTDFKVNTKSELTETERIIVLEMEIASMIKLISDRNAWLNIFTNKKKSTHAAIAADTREMEEKLEDKKQELEELKKKVA